MECLQITTQPSNTAPSSVGQGSERGLAWGFWFRVSPEAAMQVLARVAVS